ncbi:Holliday junction resolvase RuvX [Hippea sp. KM1]|uniref:Holliday junction resolvase RuvX n=1 Tax=Hippea sp. KM1 TaxID=944481 RepID=UPI00046D2991|nr:Holliday junction resolvase RuvX [Hippea sp. KM1]
MRVLGIDYGTKKIGIAISDQTNTIALPHGVIDADEECFSKIEEIVRENNITRIVVGMPITLKGEKGKRALETEGFIEELSNRIGGVEIIEWDERMSTRFSERILNKANIKGRKNKKKVIDKIAATFILQGYLDSLI